MRIFLAGVVLAAVVIVGFLGWSGLFHDPGVSRREAGPYTLVYGTLRGPYQGIGNVIGRVCGVLHGDDFDDKPKAAVFFDNPAEVEEQNLRSGGGCLVPPEERDRLGGLPADLHVMEIPKFQAVAGDMPFRNMSSIILGVLKVYPRLMAEVTSAGGEPGPSLEVYTEDGRILYILPLETPPVFFEMLEHLPPGAPRQ